MRVEAYNRITKIYNAGKASKIKGTGNVSKRDEVQISQAGLDYQVAKQAVLEAPDIREDKVSQLKKEIASGSYKVSAGDFASKLIEKYNAYV